MFEGQDLSSVGLLHHALNVASTIVALSSLNLFYTVDGIVWVL